MNVFNQADPLNPAEKVKWASYFQNTIRTPYDRYGDPDHQETVPTGRDANPDHPNIDVLLGHLLFVILTIILHLLKEQRQIILCQEPLLDYVVRFALREL